jgi:large subunit ribosomal protein L3
MTGTAENRKTQLTYGISKSITKPIAGHLKKAGLEMKPRFLREVSVPEGEEIAPGTEINVSQVFVEGDVVRVTGVSKGKGFAGVVKRHHFRGGPKTHGQSDRERSPGSIGQTTTPGRVYRGKRMAGRMGSDTVTVRNLKVVKVEGETNTLFIKGLVPGGKHALLMIRKEN